MTIMENDTAFQRDDVPIEISPDDIQIDPSSINVIDPTMFQTTKKKVQAKLTYEKMVSKKGLPYILENGPKYAKISKRKKPYDNLCHFLQFYQLWGHELFPKARFKDFITLCKNLGKSDKDLKLYRMNVMKKELGISSIDDEMDDYIEEHLDDSNNIIVSKGLHEDEVNPSLYVNQSITQKDGDNNDDTLDTTLRKKKLFVEDDEMLESKGIVEDESSQLDNFKTCVSSKDHHDIHDGTNIKEKKRFSDNISCIQYSENIGNDKNNRNTSLTNDLGLSNDASKMNIELSKTRDVQSSEKDLINKLNSIDQGFYSQDDENEIDEEDLKILGM